METDLGPEDAASSSRRIAVAAGLAIHLPTQLLMQYLILGHVKIDLFIQIRLHTLHLLL